MGLESPSARAEQIAHQLSIYGRVLSDTEVTDKIDAADAAALRRFAGRVMSRKRPALAALGPVATLESYGRLSGRFG
jgi:predicted Zn-dependent peptidase